MASPSHRTRRRAKAVVGLTAVIGLLGTSAAISGSAATQPAPAAATVPSGVTPLQTRKSLLGEHVWYRQTRDGYPVVGGLYAVHIATAGARAGDVSGWDGRVEVGALTATRATVTSDAAVEAAVAYTGGTARTFVAPSLWVLPGPESRLVWQVTTVTSGEVGASNVTYVDAVTGAVLESVVESQSESAPDGDWHKGSGDTFDPNPVVKLQNEDFTDQNDSNAAVPAEGYSVRNIRHLDKSHTLVGRWARIVNPDIAMSPDDEFFYERADDDFEQLMGYYGLDRQQSFYQSLGFTDVNAESQMIETNTIPDDNSFFSPSQDLITMGAGGVDDAEDPEVTWHEGGHATQHDQVPGFGASIEAGAIGEGFGDYIAVTLSQRRAKNTELTPWACVMDWDAVSYSPGPTHCLRRTDTDKTYPDDLVGQVHADGEIWSRALWDMNLSMGRRDATTAILEAQFSFTPSITMPAAAALIVSAATDLYGEAAGELAQTAFEDRGIL